MSAERAEVRCHVTCDGIACEFCTIAQLRAALADSQREVARLRASNDALDKAWEQKYSEACADVEQAEQRAAALEAALRDAVAAVDAEEELDGDMPDDIWEQCSTRAGAAYVMRAAVRVTKRNIRAALTRPAPLDTCSQCGEPIHPDIGCACDRSPA